MCAVYPPAFWRGSSIGIVAFLLFVFLPTAARAQARAAGFVKVLTGAATVVRAGQALPVKLGDAIHQADTLRTGPDGQLGVTLRDETRVSLGPNTEVTLATFAFSPGENQLGLVLRVLSGIVGYVSGRIAALAPESIRIETPSSIIGVRGTHLLISAEPPAAVPAATERRTSAPGANGASRPGASAR